MNTLNTERTLFDSYHHPPVTMDETKLPHSITELLKVDRKIDTAQREMTLKPVMDFLAIDVEMNAYRHKKELGVEENPIILDLLAMDRLVDHTEGGSKKLSDPYYTITDTIMKKAYDDDHDIKSDPALMAILDVDCKTDNRKLIEEESCIKHHILDILAIDEEIDHAKHQSDPTRLITQELFHVDNEIDGAKRHKLESTKTIHPLSPHGTFADLLSIDQEIDRSKILHDPITTAMFEILSLDRQADKQGIVSEQDDKTHLTSHVLDQRTIDSIQKVQQQRSTQPPDLSLIRDILAVDQEIDKAKHQSCPVFTAMTQLFNTDQQVDQIKHQNTTSQHKLQKQKLFQSQQQQQQFGKEQQQIGKDQLQIEKEEQKRTKLKQHLQQQHPNPELQSIFDLYTTDQEVDGMKQYHEKQHDMEAIMELLKVDQQIENASHCNPQQEEQDVKVSQQLPTQSISRSIFTTDEKLAYGPSVYISRDEKPIQDELHFVRDLLEVDQEVDGYKHKKTRENAMENMKGIWNTDRQIQDERRKQQLKLQQQEEQEESESKQEGRRSIFSPEEKQKARTSSWISDKANNDYMEMMHGDISGTQTTETATTPRMNTRGKKGLKSDNEDPNCVVM